MRPAQHIALTAVASAPVYLATRSPQITAVFAAAGVLIDLDHLMDFVLWDKRPLDPKRFLKEGVPRTWPKLIYLLHGYEWIAMLAIISWKLANPYLWAITIGWIFHLSIDEIGNRMPANRTRIFPMFYFFTFRLLHGFKRDRIAFIKEA